MSKTEKIIISPLTHILAWAVVFVVPLVIFASEGKPLWGTIERTSKQLPFLMILFYLNYLWVVREYLFKRKNWLFVLINLFFILLISNIKHELLFSNSFSGGHPKLHPKGFLYFDFLTNLLPVISAVAIKYAQRIVSLEMEQKEVAAAKLQSELQHLKYQLQPHFFFNSLNNIYSLIAFDPEKAQKSVHSLSKLMRHFLQKSNENFILLKDEIDFINQYIELMRLRLTEKTVVTTDFPDNIPSMEIAPLLLITLVENAFKHGVSASKNTEIHFSLQVYDNNIRFVAKNTLLSTLNTDLYSSSIGIENLKKQLNLLYPNRNSYTISTEEQTYCAMIFIQL